MKARLILFSLLASAAVPKFAQAITEQQLHAEMLARLQDASQTSDAPEVANAPQPIFTALPFEQAKAFFTRKGVMTPTEFGALEDRYKARGFAIGGVWNRRVLEEAHGVLSDSIATGRNEHDTMRALRGAFESAGIDTPGAFQLQSVYDQAILGSYAAGRWDQLTHPDVLAARPYWIYRDAGDNRVRPAHHAMNNRVFPATSSVWQRWYPPNGFRCRCGVDSLSHAEVLARGLRIEEELPGMVEMPDGRIVHMIPDPGFDGSPATQIAADRTTAAIRTEAHGSGALGQGPRDLNRASDPERRERVDRFAHLDAASVEAQLRKTPVFNAEAASLPPPGHVEVAWHMYSQNLDTAEQLVSRAVQSPGLFDLRHRISVGARATYFNGWDPVVWDDAEVVYDDELASRLGTSEGRTLARSTEYGIRFAATPAELPGLLALLQAGGEQRGAAPVRRAWVIQDVRLRAGAGVELPEQKGWVKAWRNVLADDHGRELVTLTKKPIASAMRSEPIIVNASLFEVL